MNNRLMFLLIFAADVWAAMFMLHFKKPSNTGTWEVSVALTNPNAASGPPPNETVQVWVRQQGQLGLWPETTRSMEMEHVVSAITDTKSRLGQPPEIRVLCDPAMTMQEWGPVVLELAPHAASLSIAPLPATNTGGTKP